MKRFSCILLSLIVLLSISFAGCKDFNYGKPCAEGKHVYGAWVFQNDATCFDDGTEIAECTNPYCNSYLERVKVGSKLSHNYQLISACAPTCYSVGYSQDHHECTRCHTHFAFDGEVYVIMTDVQLEAITLAKVDHEYIHEFKTDVPPGYYTPGSQSYHCKNYQFCKAKTNVTEIPPIADADDGTWFPPI